MDPTPKDALESKTEEGKGLGCAWYLCVFASLLVIYVLSIGPAVRITHPPKALDVFYSPLTYVADKYQPVGNLLDWYVSGLWLPEPHPKATPVVAPILTTTNSLGQQPTPPPAPVPPTPAL